jgi:hypothetical protein
LPFLPQAAVRPGAVAGGAEREPEQLCFSESGVEAAGDRGGEREAAISDYNGSTHAEAEELGADAATARDLQIEPLQKKMYVIAHADRQVDYSAEALKIIRNSPKFHLIARVPR